MSPIATKLTHLSAYSVVAEHAARRPRAPALSSATRTWTYEELTESAERVAGGLIALGKEPGRPIALIAGNCAEFCISWLAGSRSGLIPSMINPRLTPVEIGPMLAHLDPRLVVTDADHLHGVTASLARANLSRPVICIGPAENGGVVAFGDLLEGARYDGPHPDPDDIFEIAYTSGTTARPKAAAHAHRSQILHWDQVRRDYGLDETTVGYVATPLFHQSGIRHVAFVTWLAGGHVVVAPQFSPSTYWIDVCRVGATYTAMVETMTVLLGMQEVTEGERHHRLKVVLGGGARPESTELLENRFGIPALHCYGSSECGCPVNGPIGTFSSELDRYMTWRGQGRFAGFPMEGNEVRIVDSDGRNLGDGQVGEIVVRSSGLLREYWRDPELTAQAISDGWFHTGDLGALGPEGSIFFVDRLKDIVRRGGENISSREIENVIGSHPAVADVAVFAVPDPVWTEEVKAVVVPMPAQALVVDDIWSYCEGHLADFKVPRYLEFREKLPVSAIGRVQKEALRREGVRGHGATVDRRDRQTVDRRQP